MMGILSTHALVGTGGSGKTKAGFELGGRPLGLAALSLSLLLFPAILCSIPTPHIPLQTLSVHFNIQGDSPPYPLVPPGFSLLAASHSHSFSTQTLTT